MSYPLAVWYFSGFSPRSFFSIQPHWKNYKQTWLSVPTDYTQLYTSSCTIPKYVSVRCHCLHVLSLSESELPMFPLFTNLPKTDLSISLHAVLLSWSLTQIYFLLSIFSQLHGSYHMPLKNICKIPLLWFILFLITVTYKSVFP